MKNTLLFISLLLFSNLLSSQNVQKPIGCFAGSNGTNPTVLMHPEARGVLISERWSNIEISPGVFDFTRINNRIASVTNANLKYSLAILGGAIGTPDWVIDSVGGGYFNTTFQGQNVRLPLWWDSLVMQRLEILIAALGDQYSQDGSLSHIYVTQMTLNGVEGHLNGVDMNSFASSGFTNQKWINSAKSTTYLFAESFPNIPVVFEVHEIDQDTIVPATIMNDLYNDIDLCKRVGLAMWWISGKTTYQPDLINFIANFKGDKYAQIIGRSDQVDRFKESTYSTVFDQAKDLGIRYIEPWPYEFQYHTHDSLLRDFNLWANETFASIDTCSILSTTSTLILHRKSVLVYPNPTSGELNFQIDVPYKRIEISILNLTGQQILNSSNQKQIDIASLHVGVYFLRINVDGFIETKRIIKVE